MKKRIKQPTNLQKSQIDTMRVSNAMESRREPAYSTLRLPAGAFTGINAQFFSIAQTGNVTDIDTNIVTPSQLPYPQTLTVDTIRLKVCINDPKDWNFLPRLFKTTYLRFFINNKDYHIVPLSLVAGGISGTFYGGKADGSKAKVLAQLGRPSKNGFKFALNQNIVIGSKETFGVQLNSTLAYTLNSAVTLRLYLEGIKYVDVR